MRRTYKSKKEACDALNPKEVLFANDEKTSTFEAFYIENIKQTRRELSCYDPTNQQYLPIKKTRKRKFVKRLIREVDIENSHSLEPKSTCITPDKSIHVNKAPDPFDLLLNSSNSPKFTPKSDPFDQIIADAKLNLSSTPESPRKDEIENINCARYSEGDKNKNKYKIKKNRKKPHKKNREPLNETNINNFDLIVERIPTKQPVSFDNSMNNSIINKSLLKRYDLSPMNLTPKNKFRNNRLTETIISNTNSPFTSTPFLKRYNGKSVYKLSPIRLSLDDTNNKKYVEHQINGEIKNNINSFETNKDDSINSITEEPNTSLTHANRKSGMLIENKKDSISCDSNAEDLEQKDKSLESDFYISYHKRNEMKSSKENIAHINLTEESDNSIEIVLKEDSINNHKETVKDLECNEENAYISKRKKSSIELTSPIISMPSINITNSIWEPFLGFPIQKDIQENIDTNTSPIHSKLISKSFQRYSNIGINSIKLDNSEDLFNSVEEDSDHSNVAEKSKQVQSVIEETINFDETYSSANELFYDASSVNSTNIKENCIKNQPIVQVERLPIPHFIEIPDIVESESSDSSNADCRTNICDLSNNSKTDNNVTDIYNLDNTAETLHKSEHIDKHISFVTTRRRNENTQKLFLFNNSNEDLNDTVSNVHKADSPMNNSNNDINKIENVFDEDSVNYSNIGQSVLIEPKTSSITYCSDISNVSEALRTMENEDEVADMLEPTSMKSKALENVCRPSIVLRPGKKWERSLSIYRRMTINENFDTTVLDDEHLSAKGKKYRQSVIETMELQDHRDSVYNDLQLPRKSIFVPKSYRPSVKLVKELNSSRVSICKTKYDDLSGFLSEDCDETLIELSKLSIADSDHEVTVLEKAEPARIVTARDYVLRRCNQTDAVLFDECYPDKLLKNCHKIGEGVYGEVFLWRSGDGGVRVLKVIPIAGNIQVNGEQQKDFHEIISEIVIAMELSALRAPIADIDRNFEDGEDINSLNLDVIQNATDAFNEVLGVKCVYGSYPSRLLDLWDLFDECKGSENDNPAILPPDQQYIVLELANAGQDLESYQFNSAEQAYALFIQVAFALAVGEEAFQFEHRDLHWGNVLISPTEQKFGTFILRGRAHRVPRGGIRATIIDYSLSRLSLPLSTHSAHEDCAALYNDLAADDGLFDAVGDYQFQVYRLMRDKLGNDWKNFDPYTNILWLHYTVDKMITALRYKRTNTKIHKQYIAKLKGIKNRILNFDSAVQFVLTDNEY